MTPEQKLRQRMEQEIKNTLPKGRYLLQPVETNTVGVPDYYLSWVIMHNDPDVNSMALSTSSYHLWIEVKTTAYRVDKFQLNWAIRAHQAGSIAAILTNTPNPPIKTGHRQTIQAHSNAQTLTPIPTHQPLSRAAPQGLKTNSVDKSQLIILAFDTKMLDFSTLGAYINAKRPAMIPLALALLQPDQCLSELRPITCVSEQ